MSRTTTRFPFLTPLGVVLLVLGGCTPAWTPLTLPAPADSGWHVIDGKVRVARVSGDTVIGDGARIRGDSVWLARLQGSYVSLSREEIASIDHSVDPSGKVILGVLAVGVLVVGVLLFKHSIDSWNPSVDFGGPYAQ